MMSPMQIARIQLLARSTEGLRDCGRASYSRYVKGCRCSACRAANAAYSREYGRRSRARVAQAASEALAEERREAASRRAAMLSRLLEELGV